MKCDSSRGPARNAFPLPSMLMLIINAFCAGSSSTAITPHMNLKGPAQNALMMHISIDGKWKYIIPNNFLMIAIYTNISFYFGEIRFLSIKKDSKGYLDIQWCIAVGTKCHVGMKTDIYVLKNLI